MSSISLVSGPAAAPVSRNRLLLTSGLGWMFDALDVGLLAFVLAALQAAWGLSRAEMGWLGAVNSIGMAVGAVAFGLMADRVGRKRVFIATLLLFAAASGLSALCVSLAALMALRFFIGMGLGGELPVAATYVAERVPAHERGRVVVLLESFWAAGWLLAALIAYFVMPLFAADMGWRVALLLGALPAFYALYLRRKLPADAPAGAAQRLPWLRRLAALWSAPHRRATLMLWVLWFTVVLSYYGMFLWLPSVMVSKGFELIQSFEYVLLMTLAQLPGYFSAAWLIERMGRKFVLVGYLMGTAGSAWAFGNAGYDATLLFFRRDAVFLQPGRVGRFVCLHARELSRRHSRQRRRRSGGRWPHGRRAGAAGHSRAGRLGLEHKRHLHVLRPHHCHRRAGRGFSGA